MILGAVREKMGQAPQIKQQAVARERLQEFKGWIMGGQKEPESQKQTSITFFFEHHTPDSLKLFTELIEREHPDIIVLEHPKDPEFDKMLEGKMTVKDYMKLWEGRSAAYCFPAFSEKHLGLMVELHKKGVRIETMESEDLDKHYKGKEFSDFSYAQTKREITTSFGNFEYGVKAVMDWNRSLSLMTRKRDKGRANEIAGKVKRGEWVGKILVEVGSAHSGAESLLKKKLGGANVEINHVYAFNEMVNNIFGGGALEVYGPEIELERLNSLHASKEGMKPWFLRLHRRPPSEADLATKKLLAARGLILSYISDYGKSDEGPVSYYGKSDEEPVSYYEKSKMVNRLSYEDCRELFKGISKMYREKKLNQDSAFEFFKGYLEKKENAAE